jgi:hypothetical protein
VHTIVPFTARLACGEAGTQVKALMLPADTVGAQVALVAAPAPTLVQVAVKPVMTWPGLTTVGVAAPKAAAMSAALAFTVKVAWSQGSSGVPLAVALQTW